jgi:hypothetical protein
MIATIGGFQKNLEGHKKSALPNGKATPYMELNEM